MEFAGSIKNIAENFLTGETEVTFSTTEKVGVLAELQAMIGKNLRIKAANYRKRRSLDANGYMWTLLGEMAAVLKTDKWAVYLLMLKRYGKYTYIVVKPNAVEAVKAQWREVEEVGEIEINGQTGVQLLTYFGSSTYDTKEMAVLIDGIVSECKELNIETMTPDELAQMKAAWGTNEKRITE